MFKFVLNIYNMKYKLLRSVYKLSDKTVYNVNDTIELDIEQAVIMLKEGYLEVIDEPKTASEKMTEFKAKTTKKAAK